MQAIRPASATALPKRRRLTAPDPGSAKPTSADLAAAVKASASRKARPISDAETQTRLDDLAAVDFPALLNGEQVNMIADLYKDHGFPVRLALAILMKDSAGCHEMATEMHKEDNSQSLMDTHDSIKTTATWLRKTANLIDKAALRVFAGIARSIKEDGFDYERED